jgi:hypothetical protein
MTPNRIVLGVLLAGALASAPALADDGQRRRGDSNDRGRRTEQSARREGNRRAEERAVPRSREDGRRQDAPRQYDAPRRVDPPREYSGPRRVDPPRRIDPPRRPGNGPRFDRGRQPSGRPFYWYSRGRGYGSRTIIEPRFVRPRVVTVIPYRPYVYRPSIALGVFYGSGGVYPYGYTPRGYYDPIPGRPYGGLRITGAPRDAQVFADGYYVGIVNDFDGVFQHMNLEAGPHRIEIAGYGFEPITFDVIIQPGRTITFRADAYDNY